MNKCPCCHQWTLDFDDYFGRLRCLNPECRWIPSSSTERAIRLLEQHAEPKQLGCFHFAAADREFVTLYDFEGDDLVFEFGSDNPIRELPDPSGRVVWLIDTNGESVAGIVILGARKWGLPEFDGGLAERKEEVEDCLRRFGVGSSWYRPTRTMVESLRTCSPDSTKQKSPETGIDQALKRLAEEWPNMVTA